MVISHGYVNLPEVRSQWSFHEIPQKKPHQSAQIRVFNCSWRRESPLRRRWAPIAPLRWQPPAARPWRVCRGAADAGQSWAGGVGRATSWGSRIVVASIQKRRLLSEVPILIHIIYILFKKMLKPTCIIIYIYCIYCISKVYICKYVICIYRHITNTYIGTAQCNPMQDKTRQDIAWLDITRHYMTIHYLRLPTGILQLLGDHALQPRMMGIYHWH